MDFVASTFLLTLLVVSATITAGQEKDADFYQDKCEGIEQQYGNKADKIDQFLNINNLDNRLNKLNQLKDDFDAMLENTANRRGKIAEFTGVADPDEFLDEYKSEPSKVKKLIRCQIRLGRAQRKFYRDVQKAIDDTNEANTPQLVVDPAPDQAANFLDKCEQFETRYKDKSDKLEELKDVENLNQRINRLNNLKTNLGNMFDNAANQRGRIEEFTGVVAPDEFLDEYKDKANNIKKIIRCQIRVTKLVERMSNRVQKAIDAAEAANAEPVANPDDDKAARLLEKCEDFEGRFNDRADKLDEFKNLENLNQRVNKLNNLQEALVNMFNNGANQRGRIEEFTGVVAPDEFLDEYRDKANNIKKIIRCQIRVSKLVVRRLQQVQNAIDAANNAVAREEQQQQQQENNEIRQTERAANFIERCENMQGKVDEFIRRLQRIRQIKNLETRAERIAGLNTNYQAYVQRQIDFFTTLSSVDVDSPQFSLLKGNQIRPIMRCFRQLTNKAKRIDNEFRRAQKELERLQNAQDRSDEIEASVREAVQFCKDLRDGMKEFENQLRECKQIKKDIPQRENCLNELLGRFRVAKEEAKPGFQALAAIRRKNDRKVFTALNIPENLVNRAMKCEKNILDRAKGFISRIRKALKAQKGKQQKRKKKTKRGEELGLCYCWGDPHCNSFDNQWLHFQGGCTYTMARDNCDSGLPWGLPSWQIQVQMWHGWRETDKDVSWVRGARIEYNNTVVTLTQGLNVMVNGASITTVYWQHGIAIRLVSSNIEIVLSNDMLIEWDGQTKFAVNVPESFQSQVCGLCGNYNLDPADDWQVGPRCVDQGLVTDNKDLFGESWTSLNSINGDTDEVCVADCERLPEPECTRMAIAQAEQFCSNLLYEMGLFQACIEAMADEEIADFHTSCVFDLCHVDSDMEAGLCALAEAFVAACQTEYVVEIPEWRSKEFCQPECGENMEYRTCGFRNNEHYCGNILGIDDSPFPEEDCTEGCFCKEGFIVDGDGCVEPDTCGCLYGDRYISVGEVIMSEDCLTVTTCEEDTIIDNDNDCGDKICAVKDGVRGCYCDDGAVEVDGECISDPCFTMRCTSDSTCVDGECVCNMGFTGSCDACEDDDECQMRTDTCTGNSDCVNTEGSFFCICKEGFIGIGNQCDDMDECELGQDNCGENTKCINTYGAYKCVCCDGYSMDLEGNCYENEEGSGGDKCCVCSGDECDNQGQVCGSDGVTYASQKDLVIQACQREADVEFAYSGECSNSGCTDVECPEFQQCKISGETGEASCECEPCSAGDNEPQVVCLNPTDRFESMCDFKQAMCLLGKEDPPMTGDACDPPPEAPPMGPWSEWTPCDVPCGKGSRTRERDFNDDANEADREIYATEQSEDCYQDPCDDGPCAVNVCTGNGEECVANDDNTADCECPSCAEPSTDDKVCGQIGAQVATFQNPCKLKRAACLKNEPFEVLNEGACGELPEKCGRWPNLQFVNAGSCFTPAKVNFGSCTGGCSQTTGECCISEVTETVSVQLVCQDGSSTSKEIEVIRSCRCIGGR